MVKLPTKLDVIFSNAALHWVHDHAQVFQHCWDMLKSYSNERRQMLMQCGGCGNLRRILALVRRVMELNEFKEYFTNLSQLWYFAKPDDTTKLLEKIGYIDTKVHLHKDRREIYSRFVKTVIMKEIDIWNYFCTKKSQTPLFLDYVRLNTIV